MVHAVMGRTKRRRRAKVRNFHTCDHDNDVISLNSWLSREKCECNRNLVLTIFESTGRGVLTRKRIRPGEELISLPLNLTINITTILMDDAFTSIFSSNKLDCNNLYRKSLTFQCIFAFYIVYLKSLGANCKWSIYLDTLPKEYTVPYFLPNTIKCSLSNNNNIKSVITKQESVINTSYSIFVDVLSNVLNEGVYCLKEYFNRALYEWAYFTVNTRCVFMDLSNILDFSDQSGSILELINDNTKIALCPYLDMINHSPNAKNETKLVLNSTCKAFEVSNLSEDMFSHIQFNLYTKNTIEAFKEVFICYGDSHNLKLVTEYGFFLTENNLDSVPFVFEHVHNHLISQGIKLSPQQISFINNHGLNKDLYIDCKGLSFNFYALLMVVKYFYRDNVDVTRIIYSDHVSAESNSLNAVVRPLVSESIVSINMEIGELNDCQYESPILDNCLALMCRYVFLLLRTNPFLF